MAQTWHIFGDPSVQLRSDTPDNMDITHDPFVPPSTTDFTVNVKDDDGITPLKNALVCCWIHTQAPEVHESGYTDANGNITLTVTPQNPGDTMWVTITRYNYTPYESFVLVQDAGMPATPTVIQPMDYARLPDSQPTLTFYSTDPQGEDIQYRVLWDTDPNFGSPDSSTTPLQGSGAIVNFTIPNPLPDAATYWWKVKCTDPGGSGFWTGYTPKRSFTIGLSLPISYCSWYQTTAAQFAFNTFSSTMIEGDSVILVPSGAVVVDTVFEEYFENPSMPPGWTVIDGNSDGYMWEVGTTSDLSTYTPPSYGTRYAFYSDDDAGSGSISYNEELISPAIGVPGSIVNLEVVYGYGFRVYQTGEKYRVKVRTKSGASWSAWGDIAVYTASGSGTQTVDLTSYLPCDSVQFDWFFSDSTASSHWGWACAVDNVVLRYSYTLSNDDGTMTGVPIPFSELSTTSARPHWGDMVWYKATGADSIGIQVEYYNGATWQLIPNSDLPGNAAGFYSTIAADTVSLSALDTLVYHTIRLYGLFWRDNTDDPDNPALLAWEVGNHANYVGIVEEKSGMAGTGPMLRVYPSISKSRLHISFATGRPDAPVDLKIYDAAGRLVKDFVLTPSVQPVSLVWDRTDQVGREVPAGIYFVRFATDDYLKVEKTILVR
jgi:hypothetical protein